MAEENEKLLDKVGWQILEALQDNARLSFAEIGRRVNLSLQAVAERVRRMEEAGIITGYRAMVNTEKVGQAIHVIIRINTSKEACNQVIALAKALPEIRECHRITGGDSFVMKANVSSIAHLETLVDRLMPYGQFVTSIVLSTPVLKCNVERVSSDR
jgi:Lrp/AsnC family transcriptional regulator, leucine-responsive regulatory protein